MTPEWEYVPASDKSDITIRVKIDTVRREVRWIETSQISEGVNSVEYEECTKKEVKTQFFWIFDDRNWRCHLTEWNTENHVTLWMEDGKLSRVAGKDGYIIDFKRRPRRSAEQQAAPARPPFVIPP